MKDSENKVENREEVVLPVEENEEKRSKKRIILLLLLLLITAFMLSATTYAWFTSNKTVTVSDINVNVATSGGIQISTDGTTWKSVVTNADITGAINKYSTAANQIPATLEPVSTGVASLNSDGYLPMYYGTVVTSESTTNNGQYILTATDVTTPLDNSKTGQSTTAGTNGKFVVFDLFFKVDAENAGETTKQIYLTTSSDVIADSNDTGIKNAARVAFVREGEAANGADLAEVQALKTSTVNNNVFVWEPNYDVHKATGVSNARDVYGITTTETGGSALSYSGIIDTIAASDDILLGQATATKNSSKFADVTPTLTTAAGWTSGTNYEQFLSLSTNKITKVKVYFWVEGQDVDCENNASGGNITLRLQFSLNSTSSGN